jgi:hypothetical protein
MQEIDVSKKESAELQVSQSASSVKLQTPNNHQAKLEEARLELQRLKAQRGVQGVFRNIIDCEIPF